ncbi:S-adenosyl-L-methionine-dependent methyltransferase [Phytophthora cactorum]|nr:S-adenosyl-L-methionine-dependent methyltransferase [Phytophthora cactorum]
MSRPEHISPPELFYDEKEAAKYNSSSRIVKVQQELSNRAIELLNLPEGKEAFILDDMLDIASERDSSGDVFLQDMGGGLPFRPGVFDGCISISAVQWLCYSDKKEHTARKRLTRFFTSLYTCMKAGSRAVLQLYPETPEQMEEISGTAMRCGFSGGLVIDFPNSAKAKKFYLCLFAGYMEQQQVPQVLAREQLPTRSRTKDAPRTNANAEERVVRPLKARIGCWPRRSAIASRQEGQGGQQVHGQKASGKF